MYAQYRNTNSVYQLQCFYSYYSNQHAQRGGTLLNVLVQVILSVLHTTILCYKTLLGLFLSHLPCYCLVL